MLQCWNRRATRCRDAPPEKTILSPGVRLGLAVRAALSIILLPLIMWGGSHTMPGPVYHAGWLTMIGAAILSVMAVTLIVVREHFYQSLA